MFTNLADLRADRVGRALIDAGATSCAPIRAVVEPLDDGAGFLGTLARVRLTWADPEHGPASIVAKLPAGNGENRAIVDHFGYDRREAGVYRDLRPWERAPVPRLFAQGWNDIEQQGWLLLEDMHDHTPGDGVTGASDEQARATIDSLARLHGAYWNDPRLGELSWLPATTDALVAGYGRIFDMTWDVCVDRLGGVEPSIAESVLAARRWFDRAALEFATGDRTLVHGDARVDNVRFGAGGAVLLDFQLATHGRGVYDVAFFCAGSLQPDDRHRLEPELLDRYRSALGELDVTVDPAALWRDYRLGLMLNLPNPVSALAAVTPADERGAAFLRRNAQRGLAAVADHVALLG